MASFLVPSPRVRVSGNHFLSRSDARATEPFGGHRPRFILLLSVYCIVFSALAVLSFIAGMKLWLVRPDAIRFVRRWLWTYLIANFAYFGFWIALANKPSPLSLAVMGWDHVVGPIPSFVLWYFYLEHSKRVRATYPGQ